MDIRELYPALESAHYALDALSHQAIFTDASLAGINKSEIGLLVFLPNLEPNPITPTLLHTRYPNISSDLFLSSLISLYKSGLLVQLPANEFHISNIGSQTIHRLEKRTSDILAGISPLPVNDLMDLASRLKEIADACFNAGTPPGNWCIQFARKHSAGSGSPVMCRIEQFLKELMAFRDDAKLCVWKAYSVSGHAWDILTVLWLEQKLQTQQLITKIESRGFSTEQTFQALDQMSKKGLVLTGNEEIRIAPFGAEVRKIAEDTIDRYYYATWKSFPEKELEQLLHLLNLFHKNIPVLSEISY
ncbi:MAG: hypothetical protein FD147_1682 [Chloroflexi bacterium]|nr:MAG: hypothetical protein FD147_1682 [Chloroflexota bacterium]MBA4376500.1 hypothetical protein [Anaerolinea sp.]